MQMSSDFSVNRGTSLCLGKCFGIAWVQISRTYQLNGGQQRNNKQQENKGEAYCASRVPCNINSNAWQTICSSYTAEIKLFFFDNLSSLLEKTL